MNTRSATIVPLAGAARESFFTAQARYRASARRWTVAMTVAVLAITLVVSLLLAPVTFVLFGLFMDVVNLTVPVPDLLGTLGRLIDTALNSSHALPVPRIIGFGLLAALPGFVLLICVWLRLGSIASERNFDAVLATLGLRDPQPGDLEEKQLGNIVQEMAIAAGRQPPRLQLLDSDACNIGLLGDGERAVLIVTRGLSVHLDRDKTEALVGQAIAALGNGDGLLAERMLRLDLMTGLLMLLAQAPLDKAARAALRPILCLRSGKGNPDALRNLLVDPPADSSGKNVEAPASGSSWRDWLLMPLMGSLLIGVLIVPITVMLFVAPLNGMIWRRRRLLADAMAVQFTRDPEALGEAYVALSELASELDLRSRWLGNLFLLDTGAASHLRIGSPYPRYRTRIARLDSLGASVEVSARQHAPFWFWLAVVPLCALIAGLLGLVSVMGAGLSLALNGIFLVLPAGLIHIALRTLGH